MSVITRRLVFILAISRISDIGVPLLPARVFLTCTACCGEIKSGIAVLSFSKRDFGEGILPLLKAIKWELC